MSKTVTEKMLFNERMAKMLSNNLYTECNVSFKWQYSFGYLLGWFRALDKISLDTTSKVPRALKIVCDNKYMYYTHNNPDNKGFGVVADKELCCYNTKHKIKAEVVTITPDYIDENYPGLIKDCLEEVFEEENVGNISTTIAYLMFTRYIKYLEEYMTDKVKKNSSNASRCKLYPNDTIVWKTTYDDDHDIFYHLIVVKL